MNDSVTVDQLANPEVLKAYLKTATCETSNLSIERHPEGHSNETLFVSWGEDDFVLRRPPLGNTAETAHDVTREYRVMDALQQTTVPVPETIDLCEDRSLIGTEFYVMRRVQGDTLRLSEPSRLKDPTDREDISQATIDTLAAIHECNYQEVGLENFGQPEGYMRRQVNRWQEQLAWAVQKTERENQLPYRGSVEQWLTDQCPTEHDYTLVHGDYKLDNLMFSSLAPPKISAVVDWELSTLGDPLSDVGWMLLFWHEDTETAPLVPELIPHFTAKEGYFSREELLNRYAQQTGRSVSNILFYQVFATYKLAAICEMFYARLLTSDADNPIYPAMHERVPSILAHAQGAIDGIRSW